MLYRPQRRHSKDGKTALNDRDGPMAKVGRGVGFCQHVSQLFQLERPFIGCCIVVASPQNDTLGLMVEADLRRSELVGLRSDLQRRIMRNESARLQAIESPIDGTIATLDLVPGSSIQPRQLLAAIVPSEASLAADVYVSSRAIGLIEPGQHVRLRYDAFPHERFGVAVGRVTSVADYVLLPGDMPNAFPLREASYKVGIRLDAEHVTAARVRYALKPGMLLTAEIVLESRSLIDWLLARFDLRL